MAPGGRTVSPLEALDRAISRGRLERDDAQRAAAERLTRLSKEIEDWQGGRRKGLFSKPRPSPEGVYLWGGVGTGKSLLMDLFYQSVSLEKKRRTHFHQFMLEIHARLNEERQHRDRDPLPRVATAVAEETRLLCFDEFQVTNVADAMILGRLFEGLFDKGVVIVSTSNRVPDDLYKDGLNRQLFLPFIDMLKQKLDIFRLDTGRDYRLERLEAAPVYYTPLDSNARQAMDEAFDRLTMGAEIRQCTVTVQSRELDIPREAAGVARFTFDELCKQPLGAGDYLAIAGHFNTILIDDVPVMTPDRRDWAARFVTLIDTLYETRTKLVMSAAADPDGLYRDGDGAFEFKRTASRLMEMRSRDYLASERDLDFRS